MDIQQQLEQALEIKEGLQEMHRKFDQISSLPGYQRALDLSAGDRGLGTIPGQNLDLTDIKVGVRNAYHLISEEVSVLKKMQDSD